MMKWFSPKPMRCPACEYDLRGLGDGAQARCPECGLQVTLELVTRWRRRFQALVSWHIGVCCLIAYGMLHVMGLRSSWLPTLDVWIAGIGLFHFLSWAAVVALSWRGAREMGISVPLWIPVVSGFVSAISAAFGMFVAFLRSVADAG